MTKPIILTDEQFAMLKRLEAETARLNESPALQRHPGVIGAARKLIEEAVTLKMPVQSYFGLQSSVNLYDTDRDLPQS
jgi:hypothetical protein